MFILKLLQILGIVKLVWLKDHVNCVYLTILREDSFGVQWAYVHPFTRIGHVILNPDGTCGGKSIYIKRWEPYVSPMEKKRDVENESYLMLEDSWESSIVYGFGLTGSVSAKKKNDCIILPWWNDDKNRYEVKVGYIGENGLKPNVAYKLNEHHEFIEAN